MGSDSAFYKKAKEVGIYGRTKGNCRLWGARVGLMGAVAEGCFVKGGEVIGVIPTF